jgi:hypothetical protein
MGDISGYSLTGGPTIFQSLDVNHILVAAIDFSAAFHTFVSAGKECLFWTVDIATYNALIAE